MAEAMRQALVEKAYRAAVALFGEDNTASSIAATEQSYLDPLAAEGSPDTGTAREFFSGDREPFWLDAWKQAREKGA